MTELQIQLVAIAIVYTATAFMIWKTWPLVRQLPSLITDSLDRWAQRTHLEQEERVFLRSLAKATTDEERKRLTVARLRVHLSAMGLDISDFTDEEIEEGTKRFTEVIAATGVTVDEAGERIAAALARGGETIGAPGG